MARNPFWKQASTAHRAGLVGFIVGFASFVVLGLFLDRKPVELFPGLQLLFTCLGVALPLYAVFLGWWIGRVETIDPDAGRGFRTWRFPAKMAYVMMFGLYWITRSTRGAHNGTIEVGLFAWWLVAMAILVLLIPRLTKTAANPGQSSSV